MNNFQKGKKPENKIPRPNMKRPSQITFWIILLAIAVLFFQLYKQTGGRILEISYSQFMKMAEDNTLVSVIFAEKDVIATDSANQKYHTYLPYRDPDLVKELQKMGIEIKSKKPSQILSLLWSILPFAVLVLIWLFFMRSMQGGSSKAFSFGKSKAKLFMGGKTNVTFKDVAGVDEAKEELEEIVEFLKDHKKFQRLGGRIPRGVLLLGRPGTGKTLLAKAVAGEAGVPFFSMSGSDFVEMFVGVGASRVRDLFENAKKNAPCIAFIDEIDAVGRSRGTGLGGGHDEREQTLNQLLVEMDGFEKNDSVIIIAATNRPDVLDPALLRPGRFDRQVTVDLPDINGRQQILQVHVKNLPIAKTVNLQIIARSTPGFSGADLANLVNEAALLAARKNKKIIEMIDFEEAKDKVTMGKAKKSRVISEEDKRNTAYHEIGHVLCSIYSDKTEPVHKVTIIPRGWSGGATHYLQDERTTYSRSYLEHRLVTLMGGRCAEELVFGELTTGAGNDIERATDLVKRMVTRWGMSEKIGPMTVGHEDQQVFLGKQLSQSEFLSDETSRIVDEEIRHFINKAHDTAMNILREKRNLLEVLSEELLEKETLGTDELFELIKANVSKEDLEFIEKRYAKALEFQIEKNNALNDEASDSNEEISEKEDSSYTENAKEEEKDINQNQSNSINLSETQESIENKKEDE